MSSPPVPAVSVPAVSVPAVSVIEPCSRGASHAPFNAALLETVAAALSSDHIVFSAEAEHLSRVRELLPPAVAERLQVLEHRSPTAWPSFVSELRGEYARLGAALSAAGTGGEPVRHCILADASPLTIHAARLLLSLRPRLARSVQVVLHGNANEVLGWRARNPLTRLRQLRTAMLVSRHPRLRYLVLEPAIRAELERLLPPLAGRVAVLPHPIPSVELGPVSAPPPAPPLRVGFLGAASGKKGFDTFVHVATRVRADAGAAVEFHACGWLPPGEPPLDLSALSVPPGPEPLSRERFRTALAGLHYVCLPFAGDHYRLSASGTLLDALAAAKPIVALSTPTLEDLFAECGAFGYLCRDVAEMETVLRRLALSPPDPDTYRRHVDTAERARWRRGPAHLATTLHDLIQSTGTPRRALELNPGPKEA